MILVTGATGTVGGYLVSELAKRGVGVRALVRNPEKADSLRGYDCEITLGDFEDSAALDRALRGVSKIFLLSPVGPTQAEHEIAVVAAAGRSGEIPHVVKLAALGYDVSDGPGRIGAEHRRVVEQLRVERLATTVLAPNLFLQNLLAQAADVQRQGVLHAPAGDPPVSRVDARDVAAVAAHVLTSDGHEGATYIITGPAAVTYHDVARMLSDVLRTEVRCESVSAEESRVAMVEAGRSDWLADALLETEAYSRTGATAVITDEVMKATGRAPHTVLDFLTHHRAAFGG